MDHLPQLTNVNYPSLPFLGDDPYDGLPFASYPQRREWDAERLRNGDFSQHAVIEIAVFLQSWLYLGTINEILGIVESIQTYQYLRLVEPESMLIVSRMQRSLFDRQDHFSCSERMCLVNQVDEKAYQTRHTTTPCRYQHLVPDQDRVKQEFQAGKIPVVSLKIVEDGSGLGQIEAEVKGFSSYRWFFAISHVRCDGLGNPSQDSLPQCQSLALYDLVANVCVDEQSDAFNHSLDWAFDVGKQAMGPD
ncbi:MAG: hypothetical protein LQ352_000359 [Teloschistes flavicans]|nr:MAG: hypothetical protein LQ352_000359 [Teloschistes flavicans]